MKKYRCEPCDSEFQADTPFCPFCGEVCEEVCEEVVQKPLDGKKYSDYETDFGGFVECFIKARLRMEEKGQ